MAKKKKIAPKKANKNAENLQKDPRGRKELPPEPKLNEIENGKTKPFGWDDEIEFKAELLTRPYFTMSNLSIFSRAVLGHFSQNHVDKTFTKKSVVEKALEEYYDNHKDELKKKKGYKKKKK